ncbi:MAG: response regulator [Verrucomicrobiota bacterium]
MSISEETNQPITNNGKKRVMVVDDSLTVRKVVTKTLDAAGMEISECASAAEGLKLLNRNCYDLIFLDYILPDSTAAEFLDELLKNTHYVKVPVILMSSKGAEISRLSEFKENVVATLTKPFAKELVYKTASEVLGQNLDLQLLDTIQQSSRLKQSTAKTPSQCRVLLEKGLSRVAGHIPALEAKRQSVEAKAFYLPYLMHPDLVRSIEQLESQAGALDTKNYPSASGSLESSSIYELLSALWLERQTGRLELASKNSRLEIHLHKGSVVGVSCKDVQAYAAALRECDLDYEDGVDPEAKQKQESTGQPFLLADRGVTSDLDKTIVLLKAISETLVSQMLSNDCQYRFWQGEAAPNWSIDYSINLNIADFFLNALRRIHGWGLISQEIGDLMTRFSHRFSNTADWHKAYLTSFETVVYDFLRYEYSVAELASTLAEVPSHVAEAIHTLHKFGILAKAKQPDPQSLSEAFCQQTNLLLLSTNPSLQKNLASYAEKNEFKLHHFQSARETLLAAKEHNYPILIDDGSAEGSHLFEVVHKLRAANPDLIVILAANPEVELSTQVAVGLQAFDFLKDPSKPSKLKQSIDAAFDELQARSNTLSEDVDELESVNTRLSARQKQLDALERELQQREHELLQNEEIFFEKCNRFEEERARLDILQDNYSNY